MAASPSTGAPAGRRYGGRTAQERAEERQGQLVAAGVELFGTVGFAGTSIRGVLRESGLAERYFYESFPSLEALLVAVHEHIHRSVVEQVRQVTDAAGAGIEARARAGLRAFIETITSDPRWVRIKLQEIRGSSDPGLQAFRRRAQETYADLLLAYAPTQETLARDLQPRALALAVLSAVESLIDAWALGEFPVSLDGLIDHAVVIINGTVTELERPIT